MILREAVTSPAGTTIMAIRELEKHGVRAALLAAIEAARDRSVELGRAHEDRLSRLWPSQESHPSRYSPLKHVRVEPSVGKPTARHVSKDAVMHACEGERTDRVWLRCSS